MFIVFLKFTNKKSLAPDFMKSHLDWVLSGVNESVFLVAGSLASGEGGCILAHNTSKEELVNRVELDPFVEQGIVSVEIIEVNANFVGDEFQFLLE